MSEGKSPRYWRAWQMAVVVLVLGSSLRCSVNTELVYSCPEICICLSQTSVLCNGASLTRIPLDIPITVEELSFSRNLVANLTTDMVKYWPNLRSITLDTNLVTSLDPYIFRGARSLKEISIQHNPIAALTPLSFGGIQNVSKINLSNNKIEVIHEKAFYGSRNIGMLLLRDNPLVRVKANAFSGLSMIQFLYLPSWIKVVETDAFFGLRGVGLLKLQSLHLNTLKSYTFRGLSNVTQISIQESDLGVLKTHAFTGLRNVGEIRILNNKVDRLEGLHIPSVLNVDGVVVQGNHFLQVIGSRPLVLEANQRNVINNNYFPCSCQLLLIENADLFSTDQDFPFKNFCVSPYSLHGSPIQRVNRTSLIGCPPVNHYTILPPTTQPFTTTFRYYLRYRTTTVKIARLNDHFLDHSVITSNGGGRNFLIKNCILLVTIGFSILI